MLSVSKIAALSLMLMVFVLLPFALSAGRIYTGLRFGKRTQDDSSIQVVSRSSYPEGVQSRSRQGFYPSTRYGGKRSFWNTAIPELGVPFNTYGVPVPQPSLRGNTSPYECLYTTNADLVLCLLRQSKQYEVDERDKEIDGTVTAQQKPSLYENEVETSLNPKIKDIFAAV